MSETNRVLPPTALRPPFRVHALTPQTWILDTFSTVLEAVLQTRTMLDTEVEHGKAAEDVHGN